MMLSSVPLLPTLFLIASIVILSVFIFLIVKKYRRGAQLRSSPCARDAHRIAIGCPVIMTDKRDFRGSYKCFTLGRYAEVELSKDTDTAGKKGFGKGVMSLEIQRGYRLRVYNESHFAGDTAVDRRGPARHISYGSNDEGKKIGKGKCSIIVSFDDKIN
jgi:hypothetical protein